MRHQLVGRDAKALPAEISPEVPSVLRIAANHGVVGAHAKQYRNYSYESRLP
jgi:hypothetical protein